MLLLVVAILAGAAVAAMLPVMEPRTITVSGNRQVSRDEILARAQIDQQRNMWLQDTAAMAKRIEAIPFISTAYVHRRPPSAIVIDVTERQTFAIVASSGAPALQVDRDLRVLKSVAATGKFPVFVTKAPLRASPGDYLADSEAIALRDDSVALADAGVVGERFWHDKYGDLDVALPDGVQLLLGDESDLAKRIPLVNPVLQQVGRTGKKISAIDLRSPNTPIVVYKK